MPCLFGLCQKGSFDLPQSPPFNGSTKGSIRPQWGPKTDIPTTIVPSGTSNHVQPTPNLLNGQTQIGNGQTQQNGLMQRDQQGQEKPRQQDQVQTQEPVRKKNDLKEFINNEPSTSTVRQPQQSDDDEEDAVQYRRRSGIAATVIREETLGGALPKYAKAPEDEDVIKMAIKNNEFLNKLLTGKRLQDVVDAMYNKEVNRDETIIQQGDIGKHMYVSAKGKYDVIIDGKTISTIKDVTVFGELAILYSDKRRATIRATTPGQLWVLDRNVYQQVMYLSNREEHEEVVSFLKRVEKLNVVGEAVLKKVALLLKTEYFSPGTIIVKEGDVGDKFYIISAGTVTVSITGEGDVAKLGKGKFFGELALLQEITRQATVTADSAGTECLTLTRQEFKNHFGDVKEMSEITIAQQPKKSVREAVSEYADLDLSEFKIVKTLGKGGFGRVELVQHKTKKELVFALKYLKKIYVVEQQQQEHVYNEKNIQMICDSPFIVKLYRTYKDRKYIYFLMESCLGGDLFGLMQRQPKRRFGEKEAKFIAACVLEALSYLHERSIIYRDLKPENLLIDRDGYIKLTDFGFAKKLDDGKTTSTFAGTPEYVAPEIILNRGHDKAVDYWEFGIFIYELLVGKTPFRSNDPSHMKTYNKILSGIDNIQFPSHVSTRAKNITEKLCRPLPSDRLGCQRNGVKDVRAHKWFSSVEWSRLREKKEHSPFKPTLQSSTDTTHFEPFTKDYDTPVDETSGWDADF
uniref:cGMP-dependent protein kinase n=1 Tax=Dastarcus helophoroides TaxID=1169899 RepID=A0A023VZ86_9CUCU|nr:cGMP-dependent protein kinase [Dastarcus helophoroides]